MENQDTINLNPISSPAQTPIPPVSPVVSVPVPKTPVFLIFFVVLILILLTASGIFAYQNMKLQKQIAILHPQPTPSISLTPTLTPTPDPTANWKTYTNTSFRYSINYPNDWRANSIGPGVGTVPLDDTQRGLFLAPPVSAPAAGMGLAIQDIHIQIEVDSSQTSGETYEEWVNSTKKNLDDPSNSISETIIASTKTIVIQTQTKVIYLLPSHDKTKFFYIEARASNPDYRDTVNQILSTFKFTKENLLNFTFSVTLPDPFRLMRSTENIASYGFDTVEYLVVTNIPTIKLQALRSSTECGKLTTGQYCLYSEGTGQTKDIADVTVGGIPAKSFYISGGNDNAYHVVQTTQAPILEFKMFIAGGGLDQRFHDFLASVKFL